MWYSKPASCFADIQFDIYDPSAWINSSGGVIIHLENKLGNIFHPASRLKEGGGIWGEESGGGNEINSVVRPKVLSVWINAQENSVWGGNLEKDRKDTAKTHLLPRQLFVLSSTKQKQTMTMSILLPHMQTTP